MKKSPFLYLIPVLLMLAVPFQTAADDFLRGDCNEDGDVTIADVTTLIDYLLNDQWVLPNLENETIKTAAHDFVLGDCDLDGNVNISDVSTLIDYLLRGFWNGVPKTQTFTVNGVTFTMVIIDGGTFSMGAPGGDADAWDNEFPAHRVTVSSFLIGQTEVTQELWIAVMGNNPSLWNGWHGEDFGTNIQRPVENVSWNECQTFITKLNEMTGQTFRLPTEAEWEFAARGGNKSMGYKYAGSDDVDEVAWYALVWGTEYNTYGDGPQSVATKKANEQGLYDMSGNVHEWCQDWYGSYGWAPKNNPTGPVTGTHRVYRGGDWMNGARTCRVSKRSNGTPTFASGQLGLRLAL